MTKINSPHEDVTTGRDPVVRAFVITAFGLAGVVGVALIAFVLIPTRPLPTPGAATEEITESWGQPTEVHTNADGEKLLEFGVVFETVGETSTEITPPHLEPVDEAWVYDLSYNTAVILYVRDGIVRRVFMWAT